MINYNRLSFHFRSRQVKLYMHAMYVFLGLSLCPLLARTQILVRSLSNTASSQMYNDYGNGMAINMYTIVSTFLLLFPSFFCVRFLFHNPHAGRFFVCSFRWFFCIPVCSFPILFFCLLPFAFCLLWFSFFYGYIICPMIPMSHRTFILFMCVRACVCVYCVYMHLRMVDL